MFKTAICDNDRSDLDLLCREAESWLELHKNINGKIVPFQDAGKLIESLTAGERFDLFLLDVMMPKLNGIELGRAIRDIDSDVPVVYVTSSRDYAFDAYSIHAIRYIKKPVEREQFRSALDLAFTLHMSSSRHMLLIQCSDTVSRVVMEDIVSIENNLRETTYTLCDGRKVVGTRRSGSFEDSVGEVASAKEFIQPHKSFFVNMNYIRAIRSDKIVMDDGVEIPITRRRLTEVKEKYIGFISGKGEEI